VSGRLARGATSYSQVEGFLRRDTSSFRGLRKEERTVKTLRGEYVKFRGPLDLAKVQGGYGENINKFQAQEGQSVGRNHEGCWIHTYIRDRGFMSRSSKILHQELRYHEMQYPDEPEPSIGRGACQKIQGIRVSVYRRS
jgi:hypothetical protein